MRWLKDEKEKFFYLWKTMQRYSNRCSRAEVLDRLAVKNEAKHVRQTLGVGGGKNHLKGQVRIACHAVDVSMHTSIGSTISSEGDY